MELPASKVVVFEENRTRADLYELWLSEYDVRVAVTKQQADQQLDESVVVAILNQGFAGGAASTLLEIIRSRAPLCRVIATRERSAVFPDLDVNEQLIKPVFEEELVEVVETQLLRANYHLVLGLYYQTTLDLSPFEITDKDTNTESDEYDNLRRRASRLQNLIVQLTRGMTEEDIRAVKRAISFEGGFPNGDDTEKVDSKYRPSKCSRCGQSWDTSSADSERMVRKLGAYVWRCVNCGHVQMQADPSHQDIGSYRL